MEKIIEHFGLGLLAVLGTAGMFAIYISCTQPGGVLYTAVLNYMNGICG